MPYVSTAPYTTLIYIHCLQWESYFTIHHVQATFQIQYLNSTSYSTFLISKVHHMHDKSNSLLSYTLNHIHITVYRISIMHITHYKPNYASYSICSNTCIMCHTYQLQYHACITYIIHHYIYPIAARKNCMIKY